MAGKNKDVITGNAKLSTGAVEAIVNLKENSVIVRLDTNNDGQIDTQVMGKPAANGARDISLENILGRNGVTMASDGKLSPKEVRLLGIEARGIDSINHPRR